MVSPVLRCTVLMSIIDRVRSYRQIYGGISLGVGALAIISAVAFSNVSGPGILTCFANMRRGLMCGCEHASSFGRLSSC
jgi:hypothetical protein